MTDHVMAPIAIAELYDKISILEIKVERINDPLKLANVSAELDLLTKVALGLECGKSEAVIALRRELKIVNEAIWDAENLVRQVATDKGGSESFAAVARLTYSNNDRRANIKRKLNVLAGSKLIEEKSHSARPNSVITPGSSSEISE
jgi:uncharacterized protein YfkK (UPF0435 family)